MTSLIDIGVQARSKPREPNAYEEADNVSHCWSHT
jgi:hypothetical protein